MVFASVGWNSTAKTTSFVVCGKRNKALDECIYLSPLSTNYRYSKIGKIFKEMPFLQSSIFLKIFNNRFLE